jgi:hypothetical protein
MWTFVIAGILYLLGVAAVLFIKPNLMFTPDGQWKEFGIGQQEDRYSPFPFWLFCFVWAIVSYILIIILTKLLQTKDVTSESVQSNRRRNNRSQSMAEFDDDTYDFDGDVKQLPKGYYVLNKKATRLSGIPKYVFLGENEPSS